MKKMVLGSKNYSLREIHEASCDFATRFEIAPAAKKKIQQARDFLDRKSAGDQSIYGVNTGFGPLSSVKIQKDELAQLQVNLLRSHSVGTGAPLSESVVRKMVLLRAMGLVQGNSGVEVSTVQALLNLLNKGVTPWVPEQGSVGASGDLSPLAHLASVLIGEGRAYYKGKLMEGGKALAAVGLKPIQLNSKEGLALINGTQMMTALGIEALMEAENLLAVANLSGAMSLEAMRGSRDAFHSLIQSVRPHPGQAYVAKEVLKILGDSRKSQIADSHANCGRVQDPYSLRCIPQVHGAVFDVLAFVRQTLEREVASVTDNPLIFPAAGKIISGGNFHGEILAFALDFLAISVAELGSISQERISKLVNPAFSELPAFLIPRSGLNSGFMIVQYAAASIVSENKTLCHPASVDSIPTSVDKEDHVSMGPWAGRKALMVCANVRRILAMELLAAAQGIELLRPLHSSPLIESRLKEIRKFAKFRKTDAAFYGDLEQIQSWTKKVSGYFW